MIPTHVLHNLQAKRRRPVPPVPAQPDNRSTTMALMATAALTLAGCTVGPQQANTPLTPEQQEAEWRVRKFQTDIVQALDKVDRERLVAATQKSPATRSGVTTTVTPISVSTTKPSQDPVILASSNNDPGTIAKQPPASDHTPEISPTPTFVDPNPAPQALPVYDPHTRVTPAPSGFPDPSPNGIVISPITGIRGAVPAAVIDPFTLPESASPSAMVAIATPPRAIPDPAPIPSLDEALVAVRKMADENPNLRTALALALLNGDKDGAISQKLSPADQKIFTDLLAAFDAMKSSPGAPLAQRTAPILQAATAWQQEADLALPRLVLASRVDSFGAFSPVANSFDQGKRYTVIVYCEVANFASQKGDDGWFSTRLSQQESLITEDGLLVWRPNAEEIEDRSLNRRHDFYLVKKLTIPETLAAGKYSLRMSVTDRHSNKIAVVSLPIEIVAK